MTQAECVQLDHVLQMYHLGYHKGHRPSSIRESQVESATSITDQQEDDGGPLAVAVLANSRGYPVTNASPADRAGGHDGDGSSAAGVRSLNAFRGEEDRASSVKRMRVHMGTSCAVPSRTTAVPPTARVWFECDHCRCLWGSSSDFEPHAVVCAATTPAGEDEEGQSERGGAPGKREPARDGNGEGWEGRRDEGKGKRPASSRCLLDVAGAL